MTIGTLEGKDKSQKAENLSALKILIVEDEIRLSRFISMVLQHAGYQTATCMTVSEARELLQQQQTWSLVLTDLVMPHENGFELVYWLTQNSPDVPVVIMTAYSNKNIEAKAAQMGVAAVLTKPFTLDILRNTVETYLRTASPKANPM